MERRHARPLEKHATTVERTFRRSMPPQAKARNDRTAIAVYQRYKTVCNIDEDCQIATADETGVEI